MNKKLMWTALGVFLGVSGLIVTVSSLLGIGLRMDYTLSRYVGLRAWSVVLFLVGNAIVVGTTRRYLYGVLEMWRMPRWTYWVVVMIAVALLGLSVFPIGYFDPAGASYGTGVVSLVHSLCSRIMFTLMLVLLMRMIFYRGASSSTRMAIMMFAVYGLLCSCGYCLHWVWFRKTILVFESLYIVSFMVVCLTLKDREIKGVKDGKSKEE